MRGRDMAIAQLMPPGPMLREPILATVTAASILPECELYYVYRRSQAPSGLRLASRTRAELTDAAKTTIDIVSALASLARATENGRFTAMRDVEAYLELRQRIEVESSQQPLGTPPIRFSEAGSEFSDERELIAARACEHAR